MVAVIDTRPPACIIMLLDINEIRMQAILYAAESGIPPWVEQDISCAYLELSFCFSIHPMLQQSGVWATEWCVGRERSTTAFIDDEVVLLQEECLEHARKHFRTLSLTYLCRGDSGRAFFFGQNGAPLGEKA